MLLQWLSMVGGTTGLGGPMSPAGPPRGSGCRLAPPNTHGGTQALSSSWGHP